MPISLKPEQLQGREFKASLAPKEQPTAAPDPTAAAINRMTAALTAVLLQSQNAQEALAQKLSPETRTPEKPKAWSFEIQRDKSGKMTSITATPR